MNSPKPVWSLLLGVGLLATGFLVGYGFQSRAAQNERARPELRPTQAPPTSPPLVKGLHSSPDGARLAWTGVWDKSSQAGVWVFDVPSRRARMTPSPSGWQDYVSQWRSDGRAVLVEREKIPRPTAEAKAGLYQLPVDRASLASGEVQNLTPPLPPGEKLVSGTFAPDGTLLLKTRREPKSLFAARKDGVSLLDRAPNSYGQNRAVKRGGKTVIFAVRDAPGRAGLALFRINGGRATQLSPSLQDVAWSYVSSAARFLVVAREDEESGDYLWTLYAIGDKGARQLKSQIVPADAISVYWSRDEKQILGAAGKKLWRVSIPGLEVKQIGAKTDWNADDAAWIGSTNSIAVAASGKLWRVDVATGKASEMWKFPAQFWD